MESMPRRIDRISRHLFESGGIRITARSTDEEIDALPNLIASCGGVWNPKRLFSGGSGTSASERAAHAILGHAPGLTLNPETEEMAFDGALLWGEVFRHRYPGANWAIGRKPKLSINYGDPVLVGPYQYLQQFGVRRELFAHVGCALLDKPLGWTLSGLIEMRAFGLGLGPDPRRRVMP